jgi:hypothetical protein
MRTSLGAIGGRSSLVLLAAVIAVGPSRARELSLGRSVFTGGLADPNHWTNHAQMVDVGLNW